VSTAITPQESVREAHALMEAIDAAAKAQDWPGVVEACRRAIGHPCAPHAFYVADLWTGLAEALVIQGRYDEAIAALQSAVAAGHRAWPHPDADIARLHLLAGRPEPAAELFASLRERTPGDLWFRLAAGAGYSDAGDYETALAWFSEGIEQALSAGDPEGVVAELQGGRDGALAQLGRPPDELSARAGEFLAGWAPAPPGSWTPPPWPDGEPPAPPEPQPCPYCGWSPPAAEPGEAPATPGRARLTAGSAGTMGVAWFTADEWPRAVARWPGLLDEMPAHHRAYVRELQGRLLQIAEASGARIVMVPISLGGLLAFCETQPALDPGSGRARADYAATLLRQGHGRPWPPERNEACWCGSGRKYKLCCATVALPVG
jgi:tetratricopeptide (TPR) repeat protein